MLGALAGGHPPMVTDRLGEEDNQANWSPYTESTREGNESGWPRSSQPTKIRRLDQANQDCSVMITHPYKPWIDGRIRVRVRGDLCGGGCRPKPHVDQDNHFSLLGCNTRARPPVAKHDGGCTGFGARMEGAMGLATGQPKLARPFDLDVGIANLKPKEQGERGLCFKKGFQGIQ